MSHLQTAPKSSPLSKIRLNWVDESIFDNQEQEDYAASKLKSAVHAFLEKNGKVWCFMFYLWLLSLRIREVLNINLNHPPHAVFGISLWFYGLVLLQLWYSQQEGDDANSLVIEKDNITGEIVSQVWNISFLISIEMKI